MSLLVLTFTRDPQTQEIKTHFPAGPGEELAGSEVWRQSVWGSEAARKRGAIFLPLLKEQDLYVENDELSRFQAECETLLRELPQFALEVGHTEPWAIDARLRNFLKAIEVARRSNGGVYVG